MEPAIIKEGFEFIASKGLLITEYIADGDSSTYCNLKTLPWKIEKLDCMNHVLKNFTVKLEDWKKEFKLGKTINEE